MSKLDTVRAMILKAGRLDTPIDEARATALIAARMIVENGFTVQEGVNEESQEVRFPDDDYDIPDFFDASKFEEVELFRHEVATKSMQCTKCLKEIRKGMTFARETQTKTPRVTHYHCRSYFTEKGK